MSKIGRMPIILKEGVSVAQEGQVITVTGPKGNLSFKVPERISIVVEDGKITVSQGDENDMKLRALYGLTRAHVANMVVGVSDGFQKQLELSGVGYRAQVNGGNLMLSVGFSHQVQVKAVPGIAFTVDENTITVSGSDKSLIGDIAAKIRAIRPPEPYKGKGISYKGERIRRKAGKAAKAVGGK
jgi:large subunit ribosomal protein L6